MSASSGSGSNGILAIIDLIFLLIEMAILLADIFERSSRRIVIGLCEEHRQREFLCRWASRLCVAAALAMWGSAYLVWSRDRGSAGQTVASIAVAVVPVLLLLLAWYLAKKRTGLRLYTESGNVLWVRGAGADFLKALPDAPKQT